MKTYCDACGVEKVDGRHPNTTCSEKEWAAHQGRILREIAIALNKLAAPTAAGSGQGSK